MRRIALYLRVSTAEQSVEAQRLELREYCERRKWAVDPGREFSDHAVSGAKFSRDGLDALMAEVRAHRVDVIVCVKMDRLGRSWKQMAQLVGELDVHRVALVCTSQPIDTTEENPAGRLTMQVLIAVADFERELIRERTKAGLAVARANGKVLGRRKFDLSPKRQAVLAGWREEEPRPTYAVLAERLHCSLGKAHALGRKEA